MRHCVSSLPAAAMRRRLIAKLAAAACLAGALAACDPAREPLPAPDPQPPYCSVARPEPLSRPCAWGEVPELERDGWGSCSLLSRGDAVALARELRKFGRFCAAGGGDDAGDD